MPVPETAVDKDDLAAHWEHDIRAAGQVSAVKAIAVAVAVEPSPDDHFRTGVFAADGLHGSPSDFGRLHDLHPLNGRRFGFLGSRTSASDARGTQEIVAAIFNIKIDVIEFLWPSTEAVVKGLQDMNIVD